MDVDHSEEQEAKPEATAPSHAEEASATTQAAPADDYVMVTKEDVKDMPKAEEKAEEKAAKEEEEEEDEEGDEEEDEADEPGTIMLWV